MGEAVKSFNPQEEKRPHERPHLKAVPNTELKKAPLNETDLREANQDAVEHTRRIHSVQEQARGIKIDTEKWVKKIDAAQIRAHQETARAQQNEIADAVEKGRMSLDDAYHHFTSAVPDRNAPKDSIEKNRREAADMLQRKEAEKGALRMLQNTGGISGIETVIDAVNKDKASSIFAKVQRWFQSPDTSDAIADAVAKPFDAVENATYQGHLKGEAGWKNEAKKISDDRVAPLTPQEKEMGAFERNTRQEKKWESKVAELNNPSVRISFFEKMKNFFSSPDTSNTIADAVARPFDAVQNIAYQGHLAGEKKWEARTREHDPKQPWNKEKDWYEKAQALNKAPKGTVTLTDKEKEMGVFGVSAREQQKWEKKAQEIENTQPKKSFWKKLFS